MRIGKIYIFEDPEEDNEILQQSWVYQDFMNSVIVVKEIDRIGERRIYKYYDIFDLGGWMVIGSVILIILFSIILGSCA